MAKRQVARHTTEDQRQKVKKNLEGLAGYLADPAARDFDRLVYERVRLGMMSALTVNSSLTFSELKELLKTTDGNLSVHARKVGRGGLRGLHEELCGSLSEDRVRADTERKTGARALSGSHGSADSRYPSRVGPKSSGGIEGMQNEKCKSGEGLHLAIIMDGNGRWAKRRGLPRTAGHSEGAKAVRRTVEAAGDCGIETLTLYAFSSDNWQRPAEEVATLMQLFERYLGTETSVASSTACG